MCRRSIDRAALYWRATVRQRWFGGRAQPPPSLVILPPSKRPSMTRRPRRPNSSRVDASHEYFMASRLLSRTLPVGDWQTNLARFCFAADAGCRFTRGRFDGNVPPCCRSIARYAVVGQTKNRSPVHLLARFPTRPHEMFRLVVHE